MKEKHSGHNHGNGHPVLRLTINGAHYEWSHEFITGAEIKEIAGISADQDLFLAIKKPLPDEPILDDTKVNLARPEVEDFYSERPEKEIKIMVNGIVKEWDRRKITFKDVIDLAYGEYIDLPTMVYTVAYEDGPRPNPEGSMLKGDSVFIKNKMIFHATQTDKS